MSTLIGIEFACMNKIMASFGIEVGKDTLRVSGVDNDGLGKGRNLNFSWLTLLVALISDIEEIPCLMY